MLRKLFLSSIVLCVLLWSTLVVSVDAASMWSQTYGGAEPNFAFSIVEAGDGGFAIAGTSNYTAFFDLESSGWGDFLLVKTDSFGKAEWNRTYGGSEIDVACSVVTTSDGGYALAGTSLLVKTDASGDMLWNKTYTGGTIYSMIAVADGGYALAGKSNSGDFWLVKTDALGNLEWNETYGGPEDDVACSLIGTSDGGYALAGIWGCDMDLWLEYGILFGGDACLVKTDALGNLEWNKIYGGPGDGWASSVVQAPDGGYAIAGTFNFTGAVGTTGGGEFWLIKADALGNMQWNRTYGGEGEDIAYSIVAASDGGYALAGTWYFAGPSGFGSADYWLVKTDSLGNMQWNHRYGSSESYAGGGVYTWDDVARCLVETSDKGYAIAGTWNYMLFSGDTSSGWETFIEGDYGIVKTDELGVVPEYSSWLVPTFVLTATAFIILNKKRLLHKRSSLNR